MKKVHIPKKVAGRLIIVVGFVILLFATSLAIAQFDLDEFGSYAGFA